MMVDSSEKIRLLNKILEKSSNITVEKYNDPNFKAWKNLTERTFIKVFGKESTEFAHFSKLSFYYSPSSFVFGGNNNFEEDHLRCFRDDFSILKESIEDYIEEIKEQNNIHISNVDNADISCSKVFIVHGHDDLAKTEVARFIERIGFEPIILHEQASSGDTIIEKIEKYSDVGFGVVLYTPCDVGAKSIDKTSLSSRARQNVVFEHGFLNGKLGRHNVCALVKGKVETPNDIAGVVYVPMDEHGAWKMNLAKEMRSSGREIDMNKVV